jgi:hypothetical protein
MTLKREIVRHSGQVSGTVTSGYSDGSSVVRDSTGLEKCFGDVLIEEGSSTRIVRCGWCHLTLAGECRSTHRDWSRLYGGSVVSRLSSTGPPTVKW